MAVIYYLQAQFCSAENYACGCCLSLAEFATINRIKQIFY